MIGSVSQEASLVIGSVSQHRGRVHVPGDLQYGHVLVSVSGF